MNSHKIHYVGLQYKSTKYKITTRKIHINLGGPCVLSESELRVYHAEKQSRKESIFGRRLLLLKARLLLQSRKESIFGRRLLLLQARYTWWWTLCIVVPFSLKICVSSLSRFSNLRVKDTETAIPDLSTHSSNQQHRISEPTLLSRGGPEQIVITSS